MIKAGTASDGLFGTRAGQPATPAVRSLLPAIFLLVFAFLAVAFLPKPPAAAGLLPTCEIQYLSAVNPWNQPVPGLDAPTLLERLGMDIDDDPCTLEHALRAQRLLGSVALDRRIRISDRASWSSCTTGLPLLI